MAKIIISCAVTGSVHTPSMSDALPITPEQIASQAIDAATAGAAILHLHARVPEDGSPTGNPEVYLRFLPTIRRGTDAVINITTGGAATMSIQERLAAAKQVQPEMCSLNMGSMNFSFFPAARRQKEWKYPWEEPYVRNSDDYVFRNTFRDITTIFETMSPLGTRFEHECYDVGHLYNLAHFVDRGLIKPPFFIQTIFGILGGIGADPDNLVHMRHIADKLFGSDYQWSVLAAGRHQMAFTTLAGIYGGNVRVGLEDSIYLGKGQLAKTNAEQVTKIRRILEDLSLEIATPAEARALLGLKGGDQVSF